MTQQPFLALITPIGSGASQSPGSGGASGLFLPLQISGTGLARRLNARAVNYVACRWDYAVTPKEMLAGPDVVLVLLGWWLWS